MKKKIAFPILIVFLMFLMVSPVFAKGKPPTEEEHGHGPKKPTAGPTLAATLPATDLPELDPTESGPKHPDHPAHKDSTATPKASPQPRNIPQPHGARENFLLFGTVVSYDGQVLTVQITSGNEFSQETIGQAVPIQVTSETVVSLRGDGRRQETNGALIDLTAGQTVRVHGWWLPTTAAPQVAPTAVSTATVTDLPAGDPANSVGTWLARQVSVVAASTEENNPPTRVP
ncbi:MAG TPA: hypothetical protein VGJ97_06620 [Anaerolineaceae bacterium]|jgi:hypothetical protein